MAPHRAPLSLPLLLSILLLSLLTWHYLPASAQSGGGRLLHSSTWTATDTLGRTLPLHTDVGPPRTQPATVGMFYFIWHDPQYPGPYDNTKLLAAAGGNRSRVQYGPVGLPHHWGEPLYGYYLADDDWVVRKHGSLLADAGVDFICFDMTNAVTYDPAWHAVFGGWASMRAAGNPTPNIAIILHSGVNATATHMYEQLYQPGLYRELWQIWDGKPLILGNASEVDDPAIRDFFTWRQSWAWTANQDWFGDGHDAWPWIDWYTQGYGWHGNHSRKEEVPIAVAGWPTSNLGKSYDGYTHTEPAWGTANPAIGHYFRQQFEWALNATCHDDSFQCDNVPVEDDALPQAVFITGWNEWFAGRFIVGPDDVIDFVGERLQPGDSFFVDEYIEEYSRDIEAMRGGHGDNYYYQLVAIVRWLKGAEPAPSHSTPPPAALPSTVGGELLSRSWWSAAGPMYYDTVNDTETRSHKGFGDTGLYYTDNSTVDDLCEAQIAVTRCGRLVLQPATHSTPNTATTPGLLHSPSSYSSHRPTTTARR